MKLPKRGAASRSIGIVGEARGEQTFGFAHLDPLSRGVRRYLIAVDLAEIEVARLGMREIETGDGRGGNHRVALRELDPERLGVEQLEELLLLGMFRARRIPEGGPDAAILLLDEIFPAELLAPPVSPLASRPLVQALRERFGEPVGESLHHDRAVVVVGRLESG